MGDLAFLIWIYGLLMVVFWVVSDDLVVDGCFFGSWWQFFEALVVAGGGFNGCVLNGWW